MVNRKRKKYIHIYIYICVCVCVCVCVHFYSRAKQNKGGAQSHGPAPVSRVSCKSFKIRVTASRTSWVVFRSLGLSPIGRKPKSIRTPATCVPCRDCCSASAARSSMIRSTCAWTLSSSTDRSHPSGGCRPRYSSSARIA
jgi:hypothetical protein